MRAASTLGRQTLLEYPDAQGAFKMTQTLKEAKLEAHLEAVEAQLGSPSGRNACLRARRRSVSLRSLNVLEALSCLCVNQATISPYVDRR